MNELVYRGTLLTIGLTLFFNVIWGQQIWYVTQGGAGLDNGTSWVNATGDLQEAIDSSDPGDQIWVAAGTYYPTVEFDADQSGGADVREKTFYINKNIKVYGGFTGTESDLSQRSTSNLVVLSGDIDMVPETPDYSENSYHVVFIDGTVNHIDTTCRLEGLTIQLGRAVDPANPSNTEIHEKGAGIYLDGSSGGVCSPTFAACTFTDNSTVFFGYGGHMYNNGEGGNCSPVIQDCTFSRGYARWGGAIYQRNSMGYQAPIIVDCQFTMNSAGYGGAIYNYAEGGTGFLTVSNCEFIGNIGFQSKGVNGEGAAIYLYTISGAQAPMVTHSTFRDNDAAAFGGGIYTVGTAIISNCQFIGNRGAGGGIANFGTFTSNQTLIINSSFFGNNQGFNSIRIGGSLHNSGNLSNPNIMNSVLWGNNDEVFNDFGALPKFTNNIIQGSQGSTAWVDSFGIDGGNNLDLDPMFVNPISNDLQLLEGSPAINTGVNDSIPMEITTDLNGDPRIVDGTVDMGAFEYQNCHNDLVLGDTDSPLLGIYYSMSSITVQGNAEISTLGNVILSAPSVNINSAFSVADMKLFEVVSGGCP